MLWNMSMNLINTISPMALCRIAWDLNVLSPTGAPARTVGWRDPGFIHTSFLKDLWPNAVYGISKIVIFGSKCWKCSDTILTCVNGTGIPTSLDIKCLMDPMSGVRNILSRHRLTRVRIPCSESSYLVTWERWDFTLSTLLFRYFDFTVNFVFILIWSDFSTHSFHW